MMLRKAELLIVTALLGGLLGASCAAKEITDLEEAKKDPDFAVQGEYVGRIERDNEAKKIAAQVIARGGGEFEILGLEGGLPGAGWQRGDGSIRVEGKLEDGKMTVTDEEDREYCLQFADGKLTVARPDGDKEVVLERVKRKSPTLDAEAPSGATVLFDGTSAENFKPAGHLTDDGYLLSGVTSKQGFGDCKIHLEFRLSWMPEARGQGRSNSGVYVHDCYEIQVLDSFGLEGKNNECGGFYSIKAPDVNLCLPPMQWQTYDIDFTAPKYKGDKKVANARITVRHNGVVIHDDLELPRGTPGRQGEGPGPRPIHLQGHGNHVFYRNIWVQEK